MRLNRLVAVAEVHGVEAALSELDLWTQSCCETLHPITQFALTYFADWAAPAMHAAPTMRFSLELRHMPNASGSTGKENSY